MLLLYHRPRQDPQPSFPIYIPLCFYFIGEPGIWFLIGSPFTFHYASTLSDSADSLSNESISFTFHYASTLSRQTLTVESSCKNLHSTMLLLYRRLPTETGRGLFPFTFHYASTLSRKPDHDYRNRFRIYIPLCFYFIWTSGRGEQRISLIYIPLCFYFIRVYPLLP